MSTDRFRLWACTAVFAVIALVSITSTTDRDLWDSETKFVVSVASIGLSLGTLAMIAHTFVKEKFTSTYVEGGMILIVFAMWCAGLAVAMNPSNNLAQNQSGGINHNNLYFFSWAAFATAFMLFVYFFQEKTGFGVKEDDDNGERSHSMSWAALAAAGLVVTASAVRFYKNTGCKDLDTNECNRTIFAFSLGAVTLLIAAVLVFITHQLTDWIMSFILLTAWILGVSFVTFGSGPATDILGNLYFSTWACFAISLFVASENFMDAWNAWFGRGGDEEETPAKDEDDGKEAAEVEEEGGGEDVDA